MAEVGPFLAAIIFLLYLISFSQFHFTTSKPNGFSLKLIPRDSIESHSYLGNLTQFERIERLINITKAGAYYLDSILSPNATLNPDNIRFIMPRDRLFYMVEVVIGDRSMYLLMDTGGGLIWTQCQPCKKCFPQNYPIYDPKHSITYRKIPCNHPLCQGPNQLYQCVNGECVYNFFYGGGARTAGVASLEMFKFSVDDQTFQYIDGIIFGCSNDNEGFVFGETGYIAGIMGMNLSPDSLVSQLHEQINSRFSYCIMPFSQAMPSPSVLRFGNDIVLPQGGNVQTTPFVMGLNSYYYQLNLTDISIGFHRIGFQPDTFKFRDDGTGGCFIDSGAPMTYIDNSPGGNNAYSRVLEQFFYYFISFGLERLNNAPMGFDLCFKYKQDFRNYIPLTFHFEGADFIVDPKFVYYFNDLDRFFCIALLPGNQRTLIGAVYQQDTRFIYDGGIGALQFVPENCATDHA